MSVLIFIDTADGHVKKASLEVLCYGAKLAEQMGTSAEGVVLGAVTDDLASLGKYGVKKIHHVAGDSLNHLDAQLYTDVLAQVATTTGAGVIVFSNNVDGKAIAPRLSVRLKAGLVSGAVALPDTSNGFVVKKNVFSGKAYANISVNTAIKIIALSPNAYSILAAEGTAEVVPFTATIGTPRVKVTQVTKASGEVPLTEAEIVVSAGRGLKGPENWGIIEDLAKLQYETTPGSKNILGISTTNFNKDLPRYSTSEAALEMSLNYARDEHGAAVKMLKLRDLGFRACEGYYSQHANACTWPCSITEMQPDDGMTQVYRDMILWADVVLVATPIRWGNPSSLYFKMAERLNCVQNQITLKDKVLVKNKVASFIITGGQDNIQQVAGQMMVFFTDLGFTFPPFSFLGWSRGWTAGGMEKNKIPFKQR